MLGPGLISNIFMTMADESAAGQLANLHLDELTGDMVRYETAVQLDQLILKEPLVRLN